MTYPKGHPRDPFTDKEVEKKFIRLAEPLLGIARCQSFLDWGWHLEKAKDIGAIFDLLVPSAEKLRQS